MSCRRRAWLIGAGPALAGLGISPAAQAGGQLEEPLADSVRTALAAAVAGNGAPPRLEFVSTEARLAHLRWLGAMSDRLARRKPDFNVRREFLETVWYESRRAGLDTALVLGLIEVESGFRKYAISVVGAICLLVVYGAWLYGYLRGDRRPDEAPAADETAAEAVADDESDTRLIGPWTKKPPPRPG